MSWCMFFVFQPTCLVRFVIFVSRRAFVKSRWQSARFDHVRRAFVCILRPMCPPLDRHRRRSDDLPVVNQRPRHLSTGILCVSVSLWLVFSVLSAPSVSTE